MSEETKKGNSFYAEFKIWLRWSSYMLAAFAVYTLIKVQFYGQEMTVYSLGFQNRPVLDSEQREMLAEEALARKNKKG